VRNVFPAQVAAARDGSLEVVTDRFAVRTPPYPFPPGTPVTLYVRPERVVLIRPEYERDPHRDNLVRGRIVDELHLGPVYTLYFRLHSDGTARDGQADAVGNTGRPISPPGSVPTERRDAGEDGPGPGRGNDAGPGLAYDLEVDVAAHPYGALRVADRREWLLSLAPEALHVTAAGAGIGGEWTAAGA
jgi:hypothetical protein